MNIAAHYDLGNDFYAHFLDDELLYSSALFTDDGRSTQAQRAKWRLCERLVLTPGDHLLEIGTGWGDGRIRRLPLRLPVTTTTLSQEQFQWTNARIARAGLQDRVEVLLCDYRDLTGQYDKLSVEMITPWATLSAGFLSHLPRDRCPGGRTAIRNYHPGSALSRLQQKRGFYSALHLPGGFLPSITAMNELMTRHTDFVVRDLFDMPDYARTLAHWRQRFIHAWQILRNRLDDRFRRMWLTTSAIEAGFNARTISVVQLTAERTS
ncbi:MAG: class I SAM-dependent methyltransferase [Enterobacteriaceae bacterium]